MTDKISSKLLKIFILLISIFSTYLNAQVSQEWVARYNGNANSDDFAVVLKVDGDGNAYVAGHSNENIGGTNIVLIKYNAQGIQQWIVSYNGTANSEDEINDIDFDASGNICLTGYATNVNTGKDIITLKYAPNGVLQWARVYNGNNSTIDIGYAIKCDDLGNIYVTGRVESSSLGCTTIKYSSNGTQVWVKNYGSASGIGSACGYCIAIDQYTYPGIYIAGFTPATAAGNDYLVIKYTDTGIQQWLRTYDRHLGDDEACSISIDGEGNIYLTGRSTENTTGFDYTTIKYNYSGVMKWVTHYNSYSNNWDEGKFVKALNSNNIFVSGFSNNNGSLYFTNTIKYDSLGILRSNSSNDGLNDIDALVVEPFTGFVYVAGEKNENLTTVRITYPMTLTYNGPGNDYDKATDLVVTGQYIYVTGYSAGNGSFDFVTIKYNTATGLENISLCATKEFSLSQNYPNPFNPSTNIKFDIPSKSFVKLTIFNVLGNEISTLINMELNAGIYKVDWDGTNYPSGVYFYNLKSGDYAETKKMVLIK